jgi:hypothetical protein
VSGACHVHVRCVSCVCQVRVRCISGACQVRVRCTSGACQVHGRCMAGVRWCTGEIMSAMCHVSCDSCLSFLLVVYVFSLFLFLFSMLTLPCSSFPIFHISLFLSSCITSFLSFSLFSSLSYSFYTPSLHTSDSVPFVLSLPPSNFFSNLLTSNALLSLSKT